MKKSILVIIVILLASFFVKKEFSKLEKENRILKDSLGKIEFKNLYNSSIWGIPENQNLIPNQKNGFKFFIYPSQELHPYNVYRVINNNGDSKKTLLFENQTKSDFLFDFIPKTKEDTSFELSVEFDLDTLTIIRPVSIDMDL